MALVRRANKIYFYHSVRRDDGQVTSRYVGSGDAALAAAKIAWLRRQLDALWRWRVRRWEAATRRWELAFRRRVREADARLRAKRQAMLDGFKAKLEAQDRLMAAFCRVTDLVIEEFGYHRHARIWRRRMRNDPVGVPAIPAAERLTRFNTEVAALMELAQKDRPCEPGAAGVLACIERWRALQPGSPGWDEFVALLEQNPEPVFLGLGADMAAFVRGQLVARITDSPASKLAAEARLEQLQADLAGPQPTGLAKVLAATAATCWLDKYIAEFKFLHFEATAGDDPFSKAARDLLERRFNRSLRRYLSVLKTLAYVLKRPPRIGVAVGVQVQAGRAHLAVGVEQNG